MAVIVHLLVWLGVALELASVLGFAVLRGAIDRLHFAGTATVAGPALVAAAVCVQEGVFTTSGLNSIGTALLLALLGGGLGVATARAIRLRDRGSVESTAAERERGS
jgi:multisubunit Na+/H+ antiporter MnhG subunit